MKLAAVLLLSLCTAAFSQTRPRIEQLKASQVWSPVAQTMGAGLLGPSTGTKVSIFQIYPFHHFMTVQELRDLVAAHADNLFSSIDLTPYPADYKLLCTWDITRVDFPGSTQQTINEVIAALEAAVEGDVSDISRWVRYSHWVRVCAVPGSEQEWLKDPFIAKWYSQQ